MDLTWLPYLFLGILGAYFLGGIPWAVVLGKLFYKSDVRRQGSGNSGTTNALRSFGWTTAFLVFLLDMLKGFVPVFVVGVVMPKGSNPQLVETVRVLTGAAAIAGHMFSPYMHFKGGKGVATTSGVILALSPWIFVAEASIFIIVTLLTRYVSVASITMALAYPVMVFVWYRTDVAMLAFSVVMFLIIILMHRENLARLRAGTENRLDFKNVGKARKRS